MIPSRAAMATGMLNSMTMSRVEASWLAELSYLFWLTVFTSGGGKAWGGIGALASAECGSPDPGRSAAATVAGRSAYRPFSAMNWFVKRVAFS